MNNHEFCEVLAQRMGLSEKKTQTMLESMVAFMSKNLEENNFVDLAGLGCFKTMKKDEYVAVKPESGERYLMPPKISLLFCEEKGLDIKPNSLL